MSIFYKNIEIDITKYKKFIDLKNLFEDYQYPVILAKVNNKYYELNDYIPEEGQISFVDISTNYGFKAYSRSVTLLFMKSFYKILGKNNIDNVKVQFSIGDSLYIEYTGSIEVNQELLDKVKNKMLEYVSRDLLIEKNVVNLDSALKLFDDYNMIDKKRLFKYRRVSKISLYHIGSFEDYYYGDMAYSTGILKYFDLKMYKDGFLLMLPDANNPVEVAPITNYDKMYNVLKESKIWAEKLDIATVGALNDKVVDGTINDIIIMQESLMEKKIGDIADQISNNKDIKFVMIAGPSSSGKTSFSHRLSLHLKTLGLNPHPIALDNYYKDKIDIPKDEKGEYDFECLDALDVELFNEQMTKLLAGERINLPSYNFVKGIKEYKENCLKLGENDILVIEGIHGLNDELSYSLEHKNKFKIYISALTQLNIDDHNRISTSDLRLIRRMSRDSRTRGVDAAGTIKMWKSVRRGEENYIFPYQESADVIVNTSLIYELLMLKQYAEPLLFSVKKDIEEYNEAKRMLKFLDYFLSYSSELVPRHSLLKEFLGGSYFNV